MQSESALKIIFMYFYRYVLPIALSQLEGILFSGARFCSSLSSSLPYTYIATMASRMFWVRTCCSAADFIPAHLSCQYFFIPSFVLFFALGLWVCFFPLF